MHLNEHALNITPEDLQGRDQLMIDFGPNKGVVHLVIHRHNCRIVAWLDKAMAKLQKKTYRIGG